jgi:hypothetical protein
MFKAVRMSELAGGSSNGQSFMHMVAQERKEGIKLNGNGRGECMTQASCVNFFFALLASFVWLTVRHGEARYTALVLQGLELAAYVPRLHSAILQLTPRGNSETYT